MVEVRWSMPDGSEGMNHLRPHQYVWFPIPQLWKRIVVWRGFDGRERDESISATTMDHHQDRESGRECFGSGLERPLSGFEGSNARNLGKSGILGLGNFGTRISSSPELWVSKPSGSFVLEI